MIISWRHGGSSHSRRRASGKPGRNAGAFCRAMPVTSGTARRSALCKTVVGLAGLKRIASGRRSKSVAADSEGLQSGTDEEDTWRRTACPVRYPKRGNHAPPALRGSVLILCMALMGVVTAVSITLPILPKLGAVFHQRMPRGWRFSSPRFTLPSAFHDAGGGRARRPFRCARPCCCRGCCCLPAGGWDAPFSDSFENLLAWRARQGPGAAPGDLVRDVRRRFR